MPFVGSSLVTAFQGTMYFNATSGLFNTLDGITSGFVLTSNGTGVAPSYQLSSVYTPTQVTHATPTYTVVSTDQVLLVDTTGGAIQVNLPNSTTTGNYFYIKDWKGDSASGGHAITVTTPSGTVTIDGSTSVTINTNYQVITAMFDGTNYSLI